MVRNAMRLFVYRFSDGRACDDYNGSRATVDAQKTMWYSANVNLAWEPLALQKVKSALVVVTDPTVADWFLVDVCLARFYYGMRDAANPATATHVATHNALRKLRRSQPKIGTAKDCTACAQLEARMVREMSTVGPYWVQKRHRHIVTHFRCPRVGRAVYPFGPFGHSALWPSDAETSGGPVTMCHMQADPGVPDVLRQVHVPYSTSLALSPVGGASTRHHDFCFAGSLLHNRRWLLGAMAKEDAAVIALGGPSNRCVPALSCDLAA